MWMIGQLSSGQICPPSTQYGVYRDLVGVKCGAAAARVRAATRRQRGGDTFPCRLHTRKSLAFNMTNAKLIVRICAIMQGTCMQLRYVFSASCN